MFTWLIWEAKTLTSAKACEWHIVRAEARDLDDRDSHCGCTWVLSFWWITSYKCKDFTRKSKPWQAKGKRDNPGLMIQENKKRVCINEKSCCSANWMLLFSGLQLQVWRRLFGCFLSCKHNLVRHGQHTGRSLRALWSVGSEHLVSSPLSYNYDYITYDPLMHYCSVMFCVSTQHWFTCHCVCLCVLAFLIFN